MIDLVYKDQNGNFHHLKEATVVVDQKEDLGRLIAYLTEVTEFFEKHWETFGHEHFRDSRHWTKLDSDVVVARKIR